jgi:hypothetical protein
VSTGSPITTGALYTVLAHQVQYIGTHHPSVHNSPIRHTIQGKQVYQEHYTRAAGTAVTRGTVHQEHPWRVVQQYPIIPPHQVLQGNQKNQNQQEPVIYTKHTRSLLHKAHQVHQVDKVQTPRAPLIPAQSMHQEH